MKNLTLFVVLFLIFSCSDYVESEKKSLDGKFSVIAKVNRTDKNAEFYAEPIFEIYNSKKQLIAKIESGAGDFSRWEVGWSDMDNYLLLNSSDIGIKAWKVEDNEVTEVEPSAELYSQAHYLFQD
ncbi:hypothetical protein [uncultured Psychroserpens sp.]|uniref:hypothetical protein n=1 Tax=uncultured Psychroserpens sp. TaxID=255436 RepID=UPI002606E2EB|nr:hypothetical protein [uncultured Psychroserpens sp.]